MAQIAGYQMKFTVLETLDRCDVESIEHAMFTVDPDAKISTDVPANQVDVDSWLFPEEFIVAFHEAGYNVRIVQR